MSTQGTYTVTDEHDSHNIYVHADNYQSGAAKKIRRALEFAWDLPRFEANEFAGALVAAIKTINDECADELIRANPADYGDDSPHGNIKQYWRQGGVRLLESGDWRDVSPVDIDYHYDITFKNGDLHVEVYETKPFGNFYDSKKIFFGTLDEFEEYVKKEDVE